MRLRRSLFAAAFLVAIAGTSYAMSDGNYDTDDMGCKPEGNAFDPVNKDPDPEHDPHAHPDECQALRIGAGTDANPKFVRSASTTKSRAPTASRAATTRITARRT